MGRLKNTENLQTEGNKLTGELPPSFFNLSSLYYVYLGFNDLEGTLPSSMFETMAYLKNFLLRSNQFHAPIPASVSNASHLIEFDLSVNGFNEFIPSKLGNSQYLWWVALGFNKLEAKEAYDWRFMASLTNCSSLITLDLQQNNLNGVTLDLQQNNLSGLLPSTLADLFPGITTLVLSNNIIGFQEIFLMKLGI
ncbi:hypothetical protein KSP39_PZI010905 [Platanthera zijinensis]|uniref:Uncharacterized protein n=1 Tax=Platanthera zijinensis TaxID=2320716 RepID=A0AAP0BGB4_9ASPA